MIHSAAIVESDKIGEGTKIWAFVHILEGAIIGSNCNICDHCFIEGNVNIGDNVTIKCGVYLWNGLRIKNNVFIGPNVVFTNDIRPRSKQKFEEKETIIHEGASLGANVTILAGIEIGIYAMIGIGAVVTRSVPAYALVYGNPAKVKGWVDEKGNKLKQLNENEFISVEGVVYRKNENGLEKIL